MKTLAKYIPGVLLVGVGALHHTPAVVGCCIIVGIAFLLLALIPDVFE